MTALDLEAQIRVRKMLKQHAQRGTTVLLTTHTISHVAALADQVIHLKRGRIVAQRDGTRNVEELEEWLLEPSC
jgi:ABC-2 type transport system ATP-binding protein